MVDIDYCYKVLDSDEYSKVEHDICLRIVELYEELDDINRIQDIPDEDIDDKLIDDHGWIFVYLSLPLIGNSDLWYNQNHDNVKQVCKMFENVLSRYWMCITNPDEYNMLLNDLSLAISDLLKPFLILKNIINSDVYNTHEHRIEQMLHRVSQLDFTENQLISLIKIISVITEDDLNRWLSQ